MHDIWKNSGNYEKSTGIKTLRGKNGGFCNNKNGLKKRDGLRKIVKKLWKWKKERSQIRKMDYSNAKNALIHMVFVQDAHKWEGHNSAVWWKYIDFTIFLR